MKISFIEPRAPTANIFSKSFMPRLGNIVLATILKKLGHEVKIFIERYNTLNSIDYSFVKSSDLVCISTITSTAPRAYEIAKIIRKSNVLIVMGGVHPTFVPEESLKYCDYVVRHEGDETLPELIDYFEKYKVKPNLYKSSQQSAELKLIKGLSYKNQQGQIIHNPDRPLISDLDKVPIPDLTLIHKWQSLRIYGISTSRGCTFPCNFCSVIKLFGRGFRVQSVERTIAEWQFVDNIMNKTKSTIFFVDDNFTLNKQRVRQIINHMLQTNIKHKWSAQVSIDIAKDPELLALMSKAGCKRVYIGLESINDQTLKTLGKKQTAKDIEKGIKIIKNFNIDIHGMFIFGADTDKKSIFKETVRFAIKNKIETVQFLILIPLPGTDFYQDIVQAGRLLNQDWSKYDGHYVVFRPKNMTAQELQIKTLKAMAKFYSWRYIIKHLVKFNFFYALAGLKGRHDIKTAIKSSKEYFKNLKLTMSKFNVNKA